jgi:hypothetical protein
VTTQELRIATTVVYCKYLQCETNDDHMDSFGHDGDVTDVAASRRGDVGQPRTLTAILGGVRRLALSIPSNTFDPKGASMSMTNTATRLGRRAMSIFVLVSTTTLVGLPVSHAVASTQPTSLEIPVNFADYVQETHQRCLSTVGVEFPTVAGATSYTIRYFDGDYRGVETIEANAPIPHVRFLGTGMNFIGITGGGYPPPCAADPYDGGRFGHFQKAWANFPGKVPQISAISGTIVDADGNPFQGATIVASTRSKTGQPISVSAVSGPSGLYYMTVKPGAYKVVVHSNLAPTATFGPDPTPAGVTTKPGDDANVGFTINAGINLSLSFSATKVPSSGFSIVKGTVATTQYGKPDPGLNVQLSVSPRSPNAALTTDPKVAVCGTSGRIWPVGNIGDLSGKPVFIQTDPTGHYAFSLTIGTVSGKWTLGAWAENEKDSLSPDSAHASGSNQLSVLALTPSITTSKFLAQLNAMKGTTNASQLNPQNAGVLSYFLGTLAAKGPSSGTDLGGLTFSIGSSPDGYNVVIATSTTRFKIGPTGLVESSGGLSKSLIIDPQEWTGQGLPSTVTSASSFNSVVQNGQLPNIPTVRAWESGAGGHVGWSLKVNKLSDPNSGALVGFGWSYLPPGAWPPGHCQ